MNRARSLATIDDAAIALMPTTGPRAAAGRIGIAVTVLVAVAVGLYWLFSLIDWIAPGELIWPVPADVYAAAVFLATLVILWGVARAVARRADGSPFDQGDSGIRPTMRRIDAMIGGPILVVLLFCGCARLAVQAAGFAGLHPVPIAVPFDVVGLTTAHRRHESRDHYLLRLRYGADGRTFSDEVSHAVYDAAHEGDRVVLPVETGRFGLQRAMVATAIGVDDLHHDGTAAR